MKKIFCMICMIFSFSVVFAQDADAVFKLHLDSMDELCAGQIERMEADLKSWYVEGGKASSEGKIISEVFISYYKNMSSVYEVVISEAEFYRGSFKSFRSLWTLLSVSEKNFVISIFPSFISSDGSSSVFLLHHYLVENYVKKKKAFSVNEKAYFNMLMYLCLFRDFFVVVSDHSERYFNTLKSLSERGPGSVEDVWSGRYDMEKDLKKLEKAFFNYFNGVKVPMSKKIDAILDSK